MSQSLLEKYPHLRALLEKKETTDTAPAPVEESPSIITRTKPGSSSKEILKRARGPQPPPPPGASAEQLFADGVEAEKAEWLRFNIKETGWRSRQLGELRNWLEQNKPSKVLRSDGIGWIAVSCRLDFQIVLR